MSLDLFRPSTDLRRPSRATPLVAVPFSIAAHVLVLGAALVIPLMATDVLPTPREVMALIQTVPVPEPPAAPMAVRAVPAAVAQAVTDQHLAPVNAPSAIGQETGVTVPVDVGLGDLKLPQGVVPGVPGGALDELNRPPVLPPAPAVPVRPGGNIRRPEKVFDVRPVYPDLALRARIQGIVIIEATIGTTGLVENAVVLRSIPLLDRAALDAVRQWRFTPTLLNGVPVPIIITVTVQFSIDAVPR